VVRSPAGNGRNVFSSSCADSVTHPDCYTKVTSHHDMACPRDAVGEDDLQVWSVAANVLNKQSWTVDKG
jgi:hypothetical protein